MNIIRVKKKCALCGKEGEYYEVLSYSNFGGIDLDLKPSSCNCVKSNLIDECSHCHYANYNIEKLMDEYMNLKKWQANKEIQELIKYPNNQIRCLLLLSKQYEQNKDYLKAYKLLIEASWETRDIEEQTKLREKAIELFEKVEEEIIINYIQIADILRMNKRYNESERRLSIIEQLNKNDNIKKIIEQEKEYIKLEDNNRHQVNNK